MRPAGIISVLCTPQHAAPLYLYIRRALAGRMGENAGAAEKDCTAWLEDPRPPSAICAELVTFKPRQAFVFFGNFNQIPAAVPAAATLAGTVLGPDSPGRVHMLASNPGAGVVRTGAELGL
jgi:hypothetical protein